MIELIKSLCEDVNTSVNDAYADDADALGSAHVNFSNYAKKKLEQTVSKIRAIISGFEDIKVRGENEFCRQYVLCPMDSKEFFILKEEYEKELDKIFTHAATLDSDCVQDYLRKEFIGLVIVDNGTFDCETYDCLKSKLTEKVDSMGINATFINSFVERTKGFILEAQEILVGLTNKILNDNVTTVKDYEIAVEMVNETEKFVNTLVEIYTQSYLRMYEAAKERQSSETQVAADQAYGDLTKIEGEVEKCKAVQDKWVAIHSEPNVELDKKIQTLTEKCAEARQKYIACNEEAAKESEESVAKYIQSLNACVKEIREFYANYERKEFLESREKRIEKMEDYVKGALERKYPLRIPLYRVDNASKDVKEIIRNEFIPAISEIADKYKEYIILAPKFDDESDDMFIYLTLREPHGDEGDKEVRDADIDEKTINEAAEKIFVKPNGDYIVHSNGGCAVYSSHDVYKGHVSGETDEECIKNFKLNKLTEATDLPGKGDYSIDKDGRLYVVTLNGQFIGNGGSYDEARDIIDDDIREKKRATQNEATLTVEERKQLKKSDFGVPEIMGYPLNDEEHIRKAIQFFQYCKPQYKDTLAKNIVKKVIEFRLVGKVNITAKHPGKKYFPEWMLDTAKPELKVDEDNTYTITVDGKQVASGTIRKDTESTINESVFIDPKTGHFYL